MKLSRPRFTVRWLMIAVAIVGLAIGAGVEYGRLKALSLRYESTARKHAAWGATLRRSIRILSLDPEEIASHRRWAEYHESMTRKYERAARYPGLPVAPDPPEPPEPGR